MRIFSSIGAAVLAATVVMSASAAFAAASQKECSAKYKAAKAGNTLAGMTYAQFRKAQCAPDASATPPATPVAAPAPSPAPAPTKTAAPASAPAPMQATTTSAPVATGAIVFPTAVSPTYSSLPAGKARMKTCDDQYKANKATNSNGGLKWIEKGGGYYSECNKKLKG